MEEIRDHNYLENVIKNNINNAKSEILIAVNYIKYILYLDRLIGFVGLLKNANNKGVSIIILYSELDELALNNESETGEKTTIATTVFYRILKNLPMLKALEDCMEM